MPPRGLLLRILLHLQQKSSAPRAGANAASVRCSIPSARARGAALSARAVPNVRNDAPAARGTTTGEYVTPNSSWNPSGQRLTPSPDRRRPPINGRGGVRPSDPLRRSRNDVSPRPAQIEATDAELCKPLMEGVGGGPARIHFGESDPDAGKGWGASPWGPRSVLEGSIG